MIATDPSSIQEEPLDLQTTMETYQPSYNWLCCTSYKDRSKFQNLLLHMDLSPIQKQIIRSRYINILENLQKRVRNYGIMYYVGHVVITVGSLFVPALLSIQNSDKSYVYQNSNFSINIYWTTFIVSLLVTIFNGILTLFKIDKTYYFLNTALERFRTEGWQYFSLTGRYAGDLLKRKKRDETIKPTYRNQFIFFMHYIERFKMKQVEEEYYKTDERSAHPPNQANAASSADSFNRLPVTQSSFSPSPGTMMDLQKSVIPQPVQATVNGMVRSHIIYPIPASNGYSEGHSSNSDEESDQSDDSAPSIADPKNIVIVPSNNPVFEEGPKLDRQASVVEENLHM